MFFLRKYVVLVNVVRHIYKRIYLKRKNLDILYIIGPTKDQFEDIKTVNEDTEAKVIKDIKDLLSFFKWQ